MYNKGIRHAVLHFTPFLLLINTTIYNERVRLCHDKITRGINSFGELVKLGVFKFIAIELMASFYAGFRFKSNSLLYIFNTSIYASDDRKISWLFSVQNRIQDNLVKATSLIQFSIFSLALAVSSSKRAIPSLGSSTSF